MVSINCLQPTAEYVGFGNGWNPSKFAGSRFTN